MFLTSEFFKANGAQCYYLIEGESFNYIFLQSSSRFFDLSSIFSHSSFDNGGGGAATKPNFCAKVSFFLNYS